MNQPPNIKTGDTIYLLSTARSVSQSEATPFANWLEENGFVVLLGNTIGAEHHQFAGDDEARRTDFLTALDAPDVSAIWCMRGGYGTVRMLEGIAPERIQNSNKWLLGFSDVTILHGFFHRCARMSVHAPMGGLFTKTKRTAFERSINLIRGIKESVAVLPHSLSTASQVCGRVLGGNLSMLYSMQGSRYMPQPNSGDVLFIEDIDEYLYHIDRMLWALRNCGWLQQFSYWVVGGMTDMNDHALAFGWSAEQIIRQHADELKIPVMFGVQSGHLANNQPILFGGENTFIHVNQL